MSKADKIAARKRATNPYPDLDDVINRKNLDGHVNRGTVKVVTHPTLPLYLYNYTTLCERRASWDQVTVTCRGFIRDNKGRVIARPFQKFFGWGKKSSAAVRSVRFTDEFVAYEKFDGTMVTASNFDGQLVLATRGSFDAWQLDRVRALWPTGFLPAPGVTWVLEHVGPDNQIVVGYADDAIALIGVIDNHTGADRPEERAELWASGHFLVPRVIDTASAPEELVAACAGVEEGWVVEWFRQGKPAGRLKVKNPAWLAAWHELHPNPANFRRAPAKV